MNPGINWQDQNISTYNDINETEAEKLEIAYRFNLKVADAAEFARVTEKAANEFYDDANLTRVELTPRESSKRRLRALKGFFNDYQTDVDSSKLPFSVVTYDTKSKMQEAGIELPDREEKQARRRKNPEDRAEIIKMKLLKDTKGYEEDVDPKAAAYALIDRQDGTTSEEIAEFFHEDLDFWRGEPSQDWREERVEELFEAEAESYKQAGAEEELWFESEAGEKDLEFAFGNKKQNIKIYETADGFNPLQNITEGQRELIEDKVERWLAEPEPRRLNAGP